MVENEGVSTGAHELHVIEILHEIGASFDVETKPEGSHLIVLQDHAGETTVLWWRSIEFFSDSATYITLHHGDLEGLEGSDDRSVAGHKNIDGIQTEGDITRCGIRCEIDLQSPLIVYDIFAKPFKGNGRRQGWGV